MAQGMMMPDSRVIFLTSTKGLQAQLMDEFSSIGLVNIQGKSTYDCEGIPGHSCESGSLSKCVYKGSSMCPHFVAKQAASTERLVTSNYSCWIASYKYGNGFGHFDCMVCDEAHNLPDELSRALSIQIGEREIHEDIKREWPSDASDMDAWKHWARVSRFTADQHLQRLKEEIDKNGSKPKPHTVQQYQHFYSLVRRLAEIAICRPSKWVVDTWMHGYQFDPIEPSEYAERTLFRGVEKVLLTSGTLKRKVLTMLGIESDYEVFDYPSSADPFRCPIMYIPTTRVNYYSQPWELRKLVARIDEIFEGRTDRKGIVHTSNYKLRDFIFTHSKYSRFMISNYSGSGDITSQVVDRFKATRPPALLVTPSVTTGYDFLKDFCRYQIVAKLGYPYAVSKIEIARAKLDPDRGSFLAVQTLEQAFGRGDRDDNDFQEFFILDDAFPTLKWKHEKLFSPIFLMNVRTLTKVPPAPEIAA